MGTDNSPINFPANPTPYPVPTVPVEVGYRTFTPTELHFIQELMAVTPKSFLEGCNPGFDQKIRLLGIAALALEDLNNAPPKTGYNFNTFPQEHKALLVFGTQLYLMMFEQMRFSLIDLSYADGGLSISFDRVSKLGAVYDKMKVQWDMMVGNYKKNLLVSMGGAGLGTSRYQSNLSRMIGMLGNGAYGWNLP